MKLFTEKYKRAILQPAIILEFLLWLVFIGSIIIKSLFFQVSSRLNSMPFLTNINITMLIATIGTVLIITAFIFLIFNRKRRIALLVLDIILTFVIASDLIYFRYYYTALSVPVLHQIGLVGTVGGSVETLLRIKDLILILDFPFLIAIIFLIRKFKDEGKSSIPLMRRVIVFVLLLAAGSAAFYSSFAKTDRTTFRYDNNYIIKRLGVNYFHFFDIQRFLTGNLLRDKSLSKEELAQIQSFYKNKPQGGNDFKGIAKGKNLIVIQAEALQEFVINRKIDGHEITPNLNKFMGESLYFDRVIKKL